MSEQNSDEFNSGQHQGAGETGGTRIADELAKLMTDAAGIAQGFKAEAETAIRSQSEKLVSGMDLVHREDFEAVKEIAVKALDEVEELRARIEALEAQSK